MNPAFVSDHPQLVAWAEALWPAAERCVGWTARARPSVTLSVGDPGGGRAGRSAVGIDDGLQSVILRESDNVTTLAHELGHAWSRGGAPALSEGRADLLAECALRATGLGPPPRRVIDLAGLSDLRTWTHDGPVGAVANGYAAGRGLTLILSRVLTPAELWPEGGALDWTEVDRLLARHGTAGAQVSKALEGVEAQRRALADQDGDGLPSLAETLSGTRDDRWDTDGDGVWDGAPSLPAGSRAIPMDGRVHCLGIAGPAALVVSWSGTGGAETVFHVGGTAVVYGARADIAVAEGPVVGGVTPPYPGGAWFRVEGGTPSVEGCLERPRFTLVVRPGSVVDLPRLADAIARASQLAAKRGLVLAPFSVELGGDSALLLEGRRARVAAGWATGPGGPEILVASFALESLPSSSFGARLALAVELGAPLESTTGWDGAGETALWTRAAADCPSHWKGLVDGTCPVPGAP